MSAGADECENCGYYPVIPGPLKHGTNEVYEDFTCPVCGEIWSVTYEYSDIEIVEYGNPEMKGRGA